MKIFNFSTHKFYQKWPNFLKVFWPWLFFRKFPQFHILPTHQEHSQVLSHKFSASRRIQANFYSQKTDKNTKNSAIMWPKNFFHIFKKYFGTCLTTSSRPYKPILNQLKDDFSALAALIMYQYVSISTCLFGLFALDWMPKNDCTRRIKFFNNILIEGSFEVNITWSYGMI